MCRSSYSLSEDTSTHIFYFLLVVLGVYSFLGSLCIFKSISRRQATQQPAAQDILAAHRLKVFCNLHMICTLDCFFYAASNVRGWWSALKLSILPAWTLLLTEFIQIGLRWRAGVEKQRCKDTVGHFSPRNDKIKDTKAERRPSWITAQIFNIICTVGSHASGTLLGCFKLCWIGWLN